jgi:hypothetical protein
VVAAINPTKAGVCHLQYPHSGKPWPIEKIFHARTDVIIFKTVSQFVHSAFRFPPSISPTNIVSLPSPTGGLFLQVAERFHDQIHMLPWLAQVKKDAFSS